MTLDSSQGSENFNLSLGEIFRNHRITKKIELSKASAFLKVRIRDLQAIENDEIEKITKNIYTPGLIKSYGKYLKIDNLLIENKLKELKFKSNTENKKHILINIGEHLELTPKKELLINISAIFAVVILTMMFSINIYKKKISEITLDQIIDDIKQIESDALRKN